MTSNRNDIRRHQFTSTDRLFIDANVWLAIYGPIPYQHKYSAIYSRAWREMQTHCSQIYIDIIVLSEFVNSFAHMAYNQISPSLKPKYFKEFRDSSQFVPTAKEIAINARKIMKNTTPCDSGFASIDISAMLDEFESGHRDFNDQIIAGICQANSFNLVTHDGDFRNIAVPIITCNNRLLHV
jgi:predicted nucleic acid-binding protein